MESNREKQISDTYIAVIRKLDAHGFRVKQFARGVFEKSHSPLGQFTISGSDEDVSRLTESGIFDTYGLLVVDRIIDIKGNELETDYTLLAGYDARTDVHIVISIGEKVPSLRSYAPSPTMKGIEKLISNPQRKLIGKIPVQSYN